MLGNGGNEDAKRVAVLNGSREERPDVLIFRMAERAEGAFCVSFCFLISIRHFVFRIMLPLLPARHESS